MRLFRGLQGQDGGNPELPARFGRLTLVGKEIGGNKEHGIIGRLR